MLTTIIVFSVVYLLSGLSVWFVLEGSELPRGWLIFFPWFPGLFIKRLRNWLTQN